MLYSSFGMAHKMSIRYTVLVVVAVFLTNCASIEVDKTAADFNEDTYSDDLMSCRGGHFLVSMFETIKITAVTSLVGAMEGLEVAGYSSQSGSLIGLATGGAVGSVFGLGTGAVQGFEDRENQITSCMRARGYTVLELK